MSQSIYMKQSSLLSHQKSLKSIRNQLHQTSTHIHQESQKSTRNQQIHKTSLNPIRNQPHQKSTNIHQTLQKSTRLIRIRQNIIKIHQKSTPSEVHHNPHAIANIHEKHQTPAEITNESMRNQLHQKSTKIQQKSPKSIRNHKHPPEITKIHEKSPSEIHQNPPEISKLHKGSLFLASLTEKPHRFFIFQISFFLIPWPHACTSESREASRPQVASAGIAKRNQLRKHPLSY